MKKVSREVKILGVVVVAVFILILVSSGGNKSGEYDEFAKCITDSGAKMYGAYWCPHCNEQKAEFGNSWDEINYIECSLPNKAGMTEECLIEGIEGYPTWEFGAGERKMGKMGLEELGIITGCSLPIKN